MMKILLLAFNVQEDIYPLGLSYLKAYAQKFHPDVEIAIREFTFGNRAKYTTNKNLELQALSYIMLEKPDLVAFSCYIWSSEMIRDFTKAIKQALPNTKIVLGGVEASQTMLDDSIDFMIQGEGEIAFKEIIDHLKGTLRQEQIHNILYYENGSLQKGPSIFIENLDEIPFPYSGKGVKKYTALRLETSRGCQFDCSFCHYAAIPLRYFSMPYLEKAIAFLFEHYEFEYLTILDGTFNSNKERMFLILDIIEKNNIYSKRKAKIHCEMRPELLDEPTIIKLQKYSYKIEIELGLQSIDSAVLKAVKRPTSLERVKNTLALLDSSHLEYKIDLMYGLPQDTFFKFLLSTRFVLRNAKRQDSLVAHHYMQLNNTASENTDEQKRYSETHSSMVVHTKTQDAFDIFKTKLFMDMINEELILIKTLERMWRMDG